MNAPRPKETWCNKMLTNLPVQCCSGTGRKTSGEYDDPKKETDVFKKLKAEMPVPNLSCNFRGGFIWVGFI